MQKAKDKKDVQELKVAASYVIERLINGNVP